MARPLPGGNRKRKTHSLDGSVPGVEYNRYHGGYNRSPFEGQRQAGPAPPFPAYDPDPGKMELPEAEYEQYQWDMPRRTTPQLRAELPEAPVVERPPQYNECLITGDSFQQAMRGCIGEPPPEPIPSDHDVRATGLLPASAFLDDVVEEELQDDPVHEMASALEQQVQETEAQFAEQAPQPEPMPPQVDEDELMRLMNPFGMMM